jgi:hypothetical protein
MWKEPVSSQDSNARPMFGRTQELEGIESAREFKQAVLATGAADADRAIARALVFPSKLRNRRPIFDSVPGDCPQSCRWVANQFLTSLSFAGQFALESSKRKLRAAITTSHQAGTIDR